MSSVCPLCQLLLTKEFDKEHYVVDIHMAIQVDVSHILIEGPFLRLVHHMIDNSLQVAVVEHIVAIHIAYDEV